ncbi:MAG TPA: glycosyltransferase [Steroidobacteraceae bacterium]|jgi:glycosyltransferase involved in cell wall biosynthesis|nr:glycosyltransferase [Steroidobacteraceae bacterium]
MRLFATLGPGDIVAAQRKELSGARFVQGASQTHSGQLYRYCGLKGISALFVSYSPNADSLDTPWVRFVNLPRRWNDAGGWRFHCGRILYAIKLARMARAFRADLALIDSGTAHYFALAVFRLLNVPIAVNFHNVRWPQGFGPRGRMGAVVRALDSWFFRRVAVAAMGCSPECGEQARADGASGLPYFGWCAQYDPDGFTPDAVDPVRVPFRVLFSGRVEREKGVFDLIEIAARLRKQCRIPVRIDVCGNGRALEELRAAVAAGGYGECISFHGHLQRAELLEAYKRAHAIIVPTRSGFCEGMPLVCAEAVLSGRPVVTSRISNVLPVIGAAVAEAQPDDPPSYVSAIRRLAEDGRHYEALQSACASVARQFLEPERGYTAAVDRLMAVVCRGSQGDSGPSSG